MATLRISIPQIRPVKLTIPRIDPDEIYMAYTVHLGRVSSNFETAQLTWAAGRLSTVHVTEGKRPWKTWTPTSTRSPKGEIDKMSVDVDMAEAQVAIVQMYLYEKDDADIWNKLHEQPELQDVVKPNSWHLRDVPLPKSCKDQKTNQDKFECIARQVARYAAILVNYCRQDDFLGEKRMVISIDGHRESDSDLGINVSTFDKSGGRYEVTTEIALL
jgi:hypothetical protein